MSKRTKKKQQIADAGDFVSAVLGMLSPDEGVQTSFLDIHAPVANTRIIREYQAQEWSVPMTHKSVVYFVQEQSPQGFIKIGFTKRLESRLTALHLATPYGIRLLGYIEGGCKQERDLHARFAPHVFRAEWFYPAPEILEYVAAIQEK